MDLSQLEDGNVAEVAAYFKKQRDAYNKVCGEDAFIRNGQRVFIRSLSLIHKYMLCVCVCADVSVSVTVPVCQRHILIQYSFVHICMCICACTCGVSFSGFVPSSFPAPGSHSNRGNGTQ